MFNSDFYPTPLEVIDQMLSGEKLYSKNVLEPSAGKGDIVDYLIKSGADVIACEINNDLASITSKKCRVIASDFTTVTSDQISHIDLIVMNPPFSADEKHILHAFEIAPAGCKIIALCNWETINNRYSSNRKRLSGLLKEYGSAQNLGDCFSDAERTTGVNIGLIILQKPGASYESEFEGFFMEEEVEEAQFNGLMPYNFIRDVVNRYVAAVKLYDEQLTVGLKMNSLLSGFYSSDLSFTCTKDGQPLLRNEFKKDLQKKAWNFIISKMNMEKYTTKSLKEDLNKFVEKQHAVPFTMKNIYHMLQLIIGTHSDRMGKALLAVFEQLTKRYDENRYNVEGWKTNSHYLINEKFIMPYLTRVDYHGGMQIGYYSDSYAEIIDDMNKGLCWLMGIDFNTVGTLYQYFHRQQPKDQNATGYQPDKYFEYEFNKWYDFAFFSFKGFKKGTCHFKFKDKEVWGRFNQEIARLKGYPLFEHKKAA